MNKHMPRYPIIQQSTRCVGVSVFTFVYVVLLLHVRMWVNTVVHNFVYLCHKNRAEFLLAWCLSSNRKLNLLLFCSSLPLLFLLLFCSLPALNVSLFIKDTRTSPNPVVKEDSCSAAAKKTQNSFCYYIYSLLWSQVCFCFYFSCSSCNWC